MIIQQHKQFIKHYQTRIAAHPNLVIRFKERLTLFITDKNNSLLKDHQLTGKKSSYRAFSITGDIRVIYKVENNIIRLYDIGTHNQVY